MKHKEKLYKHSKMKLNKSQKKNRKKNHRKSWKEENNMKITWEMNFQKTNRQFLRDKLKL